MSLVLFLLSMAKSSGLGRVLLVGALGGEPVMEMLGDCRAEQRKYIV